MSNDRIRIKNEETILRTRFLITDFRESFDELFNSRANRTSYNNNSLHLVYNINHDTISPDEIRVELEKIGMQRNNKLLYVIVGREVGLIARVQHFHVLATYEKSFYFRDLRIFTVFPKNDFPVAPYVSTIKHPRKLEHAREYVKKGGDYSIWKSEDFKEVKHQEQELVAGKDAHASKKSRKEELFELGVGLAIAGKTNYEIGQIIVNQDVMIGAKNLDNWFKKFDIMRNLSRKQIQPPRFLLSDYVVNEEQLMVIIKYLFEKTEYVDYSLYISGKSGIGKSCALESILYTFSIPFITASSPDSIKQKLKANQNVELIVLDDPKLESFDLSSTDCMISLN